MAGDESLRTQNPGANMERNHMNGPQNGLTSRRSEVDPTQSMSRPFALQESLPYSPQTSVVPFIPGQPPSQAQFANPESFSQRAACFTFTSPQNHFTDWSSDIIPDPSLGSGSPGLRISDLFSSQEFDRLNQEAAGQVQMPKNVKQTVDLVLQDLKPSLRTH